jgi:hypothetical protein
MTGYEKAKALGLTNTEADLAKLRAITATPILLAPLTILLNFNGMLRKTDGNTGSEKWTGTLLNMKAVIASSGDEASLASYETWFSHITNPRAVEWDTTEPQWTEPFMKMIATFADQPTMPTLEQFNSVLALGGGRPYSDYTAEQYEIDRVAYETAETQRIADEAQAAAAREALNNIRKSRHRWDTLSANIRSQIESGALADTGVVAAVTELWSV